MAKHTVFFVTGATRGLGYEFVKQLRERPNAIVFASSRDPENSKLQQLAEPGNNVHIVKITNEDVENYCLKAAQKVKEIAGQVDYVIANAGIFDHEHSIVDSPVAMYREYMDVNCMNVIALFKAMRPLMATSAQSGLEPKFVAISTQFASFDMMQDLPGLSSAYGVSKIALNAFVKFIAVEEKDMGIVAVPIHPGVVYTEGAMRIADKLKLDTITPTQSVEGILKVVDSLTKQDEVRLWTAHGEKLPW